MMMKTVYGLPLGLFFPLWNLACLLTACDSGHREEKPPTQDPNEPASAVVAFLRQPVAEVKARKARELVWREGQEGMGLANYDAVRTGEASSSVVWFTNQSLLDVGEKTLVIIMERKQEVDLDRSVVALPSGRLKASVEAGPKPAELVVRTPRGWIKATNRSRSGQSRNVSFVAELKPEGSLRIEAKVGDLTLIAKDREKPIPEKGVTSISAPPGSAATPSLDREFSLSHFQEPPTLTEREWTAAPEPMDVFRILEPSNGANTSSKQAVIRGELRGRLKIYLKGRPVQASPQGTFATNVELKPGLNIFTFQVVQPGGKIRYETLNILRK